MDVKTLARRRGRIFTDLVRAGDGVTKLSKRLCANAKEAETLRYRLQSYLVPIGKQKPRHMIPADICAMVARAHGMQPSDLYLELTKSEQRRIERGEYSLDAAPASKSAPVKAKPAVRRVKRRVQARTFKTLVSLPEFGVDSVEIDVELEENHGGFILKLVVPVAPEGERYLLRKLLR